jgi:hypothetical protein
MNIDKKSFAIGVLALSGVILFVGNLMLPEPANAGVAIKERDYTAVTGRTTKGGEALYLTDNRTGLLAVIVYDPGKRALQAVAVKQVSDAFAGRGGAREARDDRGGARDRERNNRLDR